MLVHDKCRAWEIKIEQLERELKKYKEQEKQISRLELILGIVYLTFCIILAIVVALHTPIGY